MISAGILLKGGLCRIITLSGAKDRHDRIADHFHKLELASNPSQEDVDVFVKAIKAFCSDNSVDLVSINYRNVTGSHAGGGATFRIEGIILASCPVPIKKIHPGTIAATHKKHSALKTIKPTTEELGKAYDLAFEGLE